MSIIHMEDGVKKVVCGTCNKWIPYSPDMKTGTILKSSYGFGDWTEKCCWDCSDEKDALIEKNRKELTEKLKAQKKATKDFLKMIETKGDEIAEWVGETKDEVTYKDCPHCEESHPQFEMTEFIGDLLCKECLPDAERQVAEGDEKFALYQQTEYE